MAIQDTNKFDAQLPEVSNGLSNLTFSAATVADIWAVNERVKSESTSVSLPNLHIDGRHDKLTDLSPGDSSRGIEFVRAGESKEQATNKLIKDCFGADVFNHLNDRDWLVDHQKELKDGFRRAHDRGEDKLWAIAWRMREHSKVGGEPLIYLKKLDDGPTRGNLIAKRHDIYLRRSSLRQDPLIAWVHH